MRNFGIQSSRASLGGVSTDAAATRGIYAPRDSILIPASPPLERSQIKQAFLDVLCVVFGALFLTVTGVGLAFSLFIGFFVHL